MYFNINYVFMEILKNEPQVAETPKYDPSKKYQWTPEETFSISGSEFALLLNSFRAILSTEESQKVLLAQRASDVLETQLRIAVETGRAIEV